MKRPNLFVFLAASGFVGLVSTSTLGQNLALNPGDVFVGEYDLNMLLSHSEFVTPALSLGDDYYFRVTGRYGLGPLDRVDSMDDAAWASYRGPDGNWGPLDVWHYAYTAFKIDGQAGIRPSPDGYRTDHTYTWTLEGNDLPVTIAFDDSPVDDNVGGPLHFELYEVPEPAIPSLLALGAFLLVGRCSNHSRGS
jgi:hypothetical protein